MSTRSTRALLLVVVGTVLVLNSFAATGVGPAEPAYEHKAYSQHSAESIKSTSDAVERSSSSDTVLLTSSSTVISIVLLAGYNHSGGSAPLEHDVRKEIYEIVNQTSGIYVSDLQDTCDLHRSTLRYHLEILEREDLLASETLFGKLWYYPSSNNIKELRAALTHDPTGEILDAIARLEPVKVMDLANEVDRSSSTVSHHLEHLEEEGLVERERRSTAVLSRLPPDVRTELGTSANPEDSMRG